MIGYKLTLHLQLHLHLHLQLRARQQYICIRRYKNWSRDNGDDVDVQIATLAIQDVGSCVYVSLDRFT